MNETHLISTWLLYFFVYSFIGWVWESCYVSILQRKWVNRGFIKGPFLPLYGSGAIVLLLVSQPFTDNLVKVYFAGVIGATILEYITGALMEALFKVRYWDYSNQKFNIKGYICLSSSVAWGFFTILMTEYIHPFVVKLLSYVPPLVQNIALIVITVSFSYDFIMAFKNALQLRFLLEKLAAARSELLDLTDKLENTIKGNLASAKNTLTDNLESVSNHQLLKELSERKAFALESLQRSKKPGWRGDSNIIRQQFSSLASFMERISNDLKNAHAGIPNTMSDRILHWKEPFIRAFSSVTDRQRKVLKNHSHAVSKKYTVELELLKESLKESGKKKKEKK